MLIHLPEVLTADELGRVRDILEHAPWQDGRITAGSIAAQAKNNLQLDDFCAESNAARDIVLGALERNATFFTAALPKRIFPPLFNRYAGASNHFGNHVDNAVRTIRGTTQRVRTDLSATLFVSPPSDYDGGELVIEDTYGTHTVKLAAGDMVLYPSSSLHRVTPVTRGARTACFMWMESMVRDLDKRRLLYEMDMNIMDMRAAVGDIEPVMKMTSVYHNLLRMWAST